MEWVFPFLFGLALLISFIFLGMPVGFALLTLGLLGLILWAGLVPAFGILTFESLYRTPNNFMLLVVPLFILMAQILTHSRTTELLYRCFWTLFAGIRGSLAAATIGMGTLLGACMGASVANVATMAHLGLEQMMKRGYRKWLAAGSIAGAGGLAIIIPPSIPAITYAFIMELPILEIFAACLIPGFMMGIGYGVITLVYTRFNPKAAPAGPAVSGAERLKAFVTILPFLGLVILVLGSIFSGLSSITESAAFGCLGAFIIAVTMGVKKDRLRNTLEAGRSTAVTTCYILLIIIGAKLFGQFWTYTGVITALSQAISSLALPPIGVLLLMNVLILFFGTLMDSLAIILVVLPIMVTGLTPMGFNPLHLGVIFLVNLEMGLTTPPVGMNIFVLAGVSEPYGIGYWDIVKGAIPFLLVDLVVLLLCIAFPGLTLWLPSILR